MHIIKIEKHFLDQSKTILLITKNIMYFDSFTGCGNTLLKSL